MQRDTPRKAVGRLDAEHEAIRRDRVDYDPPKPLVKLADQRSESWPNGTAWLKIPGEVE